MSQVTVTIAGRSYRIACGEGEEEHLQSLAALYDGRIEDMRAAFGEIGDMRLHVMAAITIADAFTEERRRAEALEAELAAVRQLALSGDERSLLVEARVIEGISRAAERVERLAKALNAASPSP
jgi:cell division protein ZapA